MFRSLMTIIREIHLYLTKVIFKLKLSVNVRLYIYLVMWQHVVERHVCCVLCRMRLSFCTAHNTHDVILPNILT